MDLVPVSFSEGGSEANRTFIYPPVCFRSEGWDGLDGDGISGGGLAWDGMGDITCDIEDMRYIIPLWILGHN